MKMIFARLMLATSLFVTPFTHANTDNLSTQLSAFVESKKLPGMVVMVEHSGETVFHDAIGYESIEQQAMTVDARFRWFSMSKPITALAMLNTISTK